MMSQPVATIQMAPTSSSLIAWGSNETSAHQTPKIVIAIKRVRRLKRRGIAGHRGRELVSDGGGGGAEAWESVRMVESVTV